MVPWTCMWQELCKARQEHASHGEPRGWQVVWTPTSVSWSWLMFGPTPRSYELEVDSKRAALDLEALLNISALFGIELLGRSDHQKIQL
eukprot:3127284-Amphidinium_carterae.1